VKLCKQSRVHGLCRYKNFLHLSYVSVHANYTSNTAACYDNEVSLRLMYCNAPALCCRRCHINKVSSWHVTLIFTRPLEMMVITPVRHKRHMQFLTSAANFRRGQLTPPPLTGPSRAPEFCNWPGVRNRRLHLRDPLHPFINSSVLWSWCRTPKLRSCTALRSCRWQQLTTMYVIVFFIVKNTEKLAIAIRTYNFISATQITVNVKCYYKKRKLNVSRKQRFKGSFKTY